LFSWHGLSLCSTVVDAGLAGLFQAVAAGLADRVAAAVVFVVGRHISDRRVLSVLQGSRCGGWSVLPSLCSSRAVAENLVGATGVVQARRAVCSSGAAWGVEPGHEVAVRCPGGGQVLGAFLELQAKVDGLLFEVGDLALELVDVGGGAES